MNNKFSKGMFIECKKASTAIRRFFKSVNIEEVKEWEEELLESIDNGYFELHCDDCGYHFSLEEHHQDFDGGYWYMDLTVVY